jgi:site-specific DNA-methyltransferase (adenine-specific)/adenine-specific DNA-methyltransferase
MARPSSSAHYDLTETEKRDLIKLIEQGRPLPEKYRFLLFEDKREVELVWNGKIRDVCTAVLPFQTLEHIDEPRKEKAQEEELGFDMGGRQVAGWTNKLIWGDNKLILSSLKSGALRRQIEDAGGTEAHLHRPAIRCRSRLLHGHRNWWGDLPQGAEPLGANRLPGYVGPWS